MNSVCSSDHNSITFNLNTKVKVDINRRTIYNFKKAHWDDLISDLCSFDWDIFFKMCSSSDEAWRFFKTVLILLMDRNIPTITIDNRRRLPWFDSETEDLCNKKKRLHRKWKKSGKQKDYDNFVNCRKSYKSMMQDKMESNLNGDEDDPALLKKRFWGHTKATSKSTRIPESVFYDDRHRNDAMGQAELFNEFFANQFSDPSSYDIPIDPDDGYDDSINFSPEVVCRFLKQVKPQKAAGPDGIHGMVLKNCAIGLAVPLSKLFYMSYNTGTIPEEWKFANVVPVFKKGSKNDVKNYRPISLTCLVSKVFEKIVRDRIMEICKDKLCSNQHGFLPAKSCTTQMIEVNESIAFSINGKCQVDSVYFDFAKAFDSVHHDTLLMKLKEEYNIDGKLLILLTDYLKDRQQCVVISGCKSAMRSVASGVPQGSILGPLLFVLFINDIVSDVSDGTNIALYADDTKIWRTIRTWADHVILQDDIDCLYAWSVSNKMKFHPGKCKVLQFNDKRICMYDKSFMERFPIDPYFMNGCVLEYAHVERDLGVMMTTNLSWDEQRNSRLRVSSSRLGLMKRVCHFIRNRVQRRALYLALVRSQYEHCCEIWRPVSASMIEKFETVQRRAVKWVLNEEYLDYTPSEYLQRLRNLNLLPMDYYFRHNDLLLFHKIYYEVICVKLPFYYRNSDDQDRSRLRSTTRPPICLDNRQPTIDLSTLRSQNSDDLSLMCDIPFISKAYKSSFMFRAHILWNHLPTDIRKIECPIKYREALDSHLWDLAMRPD